MVKFNLCNKKLKGMFGRDNFLLIALTTYSSVLLFSIMVFDNLNYSSLFYFICKIENFPMKEEGLKGELNFKKKE